MSCQLIIHAKIGPHKARGHFTDTNLVISVKIWSMSFDWLRGRKYVHWQEEGEKYDQRQKGGWNQSMIIG